MADSDKINTANRIIKAQDELIESFNDWVKYVKSNNLEEASKIVTLSNALRIKIKDLKKEYEKLNKKSGIILLNNSIKGN
jgi:hypothetical protein